MVSLHSLAGHKLTTILLLQSLKCEETPVLPQDWTLKPHCVSFTDKGLLQAFQFNTCSEAVLAALGQSSN